MKKYLLALGLVAFMMTSCCDKQENNANCEQNCKEKHEQCDHHGDKPGMCPEMMAKIDMMVMALANWEDLDEAQRADAINMAKEMAAKKAECEQQHEGCNHQHEGCQHQHEGCQGNHEGCQGNHEGCQHQHEGCQHEGQHEGCQHQHEGCQHEAK